jgi:hypothetical protein
MLLMIRCQSFDTTGDQAQYFSKEEKVLRSIGREPQKPYNNHKVLLNKVMHTKESKSPTGPNVIG